VVTNGTAGGSGLEGLTITLYGFSGGQRGEQRAAPLDATGRARFAGLPAGPERTYIAGAEYQGAAYYSRPVRLPIPAEEGAPPPQARLTVYEAGAPAEAVRVGSVSLVLAGLDPQARSLTLWEIITLANSSDRTYLEQVRGAARLRFPIPERAEDLDLRFAAGSAEVLRTAPGSLSVTAVPPGEHELILAYRLRYGSSAVRIEKRYPFPVGHVRLLVPAGGPQVQAEGIALQSTAAIAEKQFALYAAADLAPGRRVAVQFSGLPAPGRPIPLRSAVPAGAGALLVAALGGAFAIRSRRGRPATPRLAAPPTAAGRSDSATALDAAFERGELGAEEYFRRREALAPARPRPDGS